MADLFARDTGIVLLIAGFAILIALPVQLVLCIKAKKLFYKCLPTTILAVLVITFYIMAITAKTWVAFAYLIIAVFSGVSLIFSGITLGIWVIIKFVKKQSGN